METRTLRQCAAVRRELVARQCQMQADQGKIAAETAAREAREAYLGEHGKDAAGALDASIEQLWQAFVALQNCADAEAPEARVARFLELAAEIGFDPDEAQDLLYELGLIGV